MIKFVSAILFTLKHLNMRAFLRSSLESLFFIQMHFIMNGDHNLDQHNIRGIWNQLVAMNAQLLNCVGYKPISVYYMS